MNPRLLFIAFALFVLSLTPQNGYAQVLTYSKNGLQVEVTVRNACDPAISNGAITFKLIASTSGRARLVLITGPSTTDFPDFDFQLPGTTTFTYIPNSPQNGTYDFVIRDPLNDSDFINTLVASVDGANLKALPPILLGQSSLIDNTNCTNPNGQIQATLSGGSKSPALSVPGSFNYTWTSTYALTGLPLTGTWDGTGSLDLASLLSISGLPGGKYTLQITDNYSQCTEEKEYTILDSSPVAFAVSPASVTGCINSDLTIQLANSESAIVEYQVLENGSPTGIKKTGVSGPLSFIIPGSQFSNDGTYVYTILATNGICTPLPMTGSTTVTINTKVNLVSTSTDPKCTGGSDGTITLSGSGGSGSYEYSIDNGTTFQSSGNFIGLPSGTYTVVAKDTNGCGSDSKNITINNPTPVTFTSSFTEPSCTLGNDGTLTLTGNGGAAPYSFSIDNGVTFTTTATFNGLAAGIYTAQIKDSFGCTSPTASITITAPTPVTFTFTSLNPTCLGKSDGSISITAAGGSGTYQYSSDNGLSFGSGSTITSLAAGTFPLVVKDSKNCLSTPTPAVLTNPPAVTLTSSSTPETCFESKDATITLNGAGGTGTFSYSINGGASFQSTDTFTGQSAGTFQVVVKDSNGCLSDPATLTIQATTKVSTTFTSSDPTSCVPGNDGSFTLSANGGNGPYTFSNDNGTTFVASGNFTGLSAGSFNVKSKDSKGCLSDAVPITLKPPFTVTLSGTTTAPTCNGDTDGALSATASGGNGTYSFSITNGVSIQPSGTFSNLGAGAYTVLAKDGVGCEGEVTLNVTQPAVLGFTATPDQVSCNGSTDGEIVITATGGNGTYQYSTDNGATYQISNQFKNLIPGTYQVVVKDVKNCLTPAQSVIVVEPAVLSVAATKTDVTRCDPGNDGTLTATVTGGTGPFTYSIDGTNFQSSPTFTGLEGGLYVVTALDSRGCSEFAPVSINVPSGPLFFFSVQDLKCFNDNSGKINITGFGGTNPLQYSANGGTSFQGTGNFSGLAAGDYDLVVKDAKGCKFEISTSLFQPAELIPTITTTPVLCSGESNATITISAVGGNASYEYSINNGSTFSTNSSFTNLNAGDYTVIVRDGQSCLSSPRTVNLANPPVFLVATTVTNAGCSNNDGLFQVTTFGGTPPYTYEFNNTVLPSLPAGGSFEGLSAGSYTFKITDSRGCSFNRSFDITFPGNISVTATGTAPDCNSNGSNGFITVNLTTAGNFQAGITNNPPNEPQNFIAVTNGTFNFNNLTNGNYAVTIRHNSLCPAILPITITGGPSPVAFTSEVIEKLCFEDRSFIRLNGIKGNPTLSYVAEIKSGPSVYKTEVISSAASSGPVEIDIPDAGSYQLIFSQDQSSVTPCTNAIAAAPVTFSLDAPGAVLDIADVSKTISLPDLPTGSLSGSVVESTEEPYQAKLELLVPHEPGQSFLSDFEILNRNPDNGKVEFEYTKIFAGDYAFTLKDSFGCVKTYDITVDFDPKLFIPNIFTPDGDGINEEFYIRNLPPNSDLYITDSWGQRVFSSGNYQNDWTGKGMPNGVYYYKLSIGRKNYTGWVELLNGK